MFFFAEDEPASSRGMPKTADYLYAFRGTFDREPHGITWLWVSGEASQTPVIVMGELPQNTSTSETSMAEYLVPQLIQRHFPQRFEELPPVIFLEHSVEERTPQGRLGRKTTWNQLSFHCWALRRVWLSGQERLSFGDPHWEHLPEHEVEALLGKAEMATIPPDRQITGDES